MALTKRHQMWSEVELVGVQAVALSHFILFVIRTNTSQPSALP